MITTQREDGIVLWVNAYPNLFPTLEAAVEALANSLAMQDPEVKGTN
jgi:hypothetical protein